MIARVPGKKFLTQRSLMTLALEACGNAMFMIPLQCEGS
jgi:hypothetical protein